ncbi:MAG: MmcQ/YjbR family DNA-binding protein [Muribaculaceae bacterium]|nr:MmcQ/YjbR family DNA-binding protein [Muribaculaceae bacterium]
MNIEAIREYCLSLPLASEDMAFGEDHLVLRVCGKIFACIGLTDTDYLAIKCDPDYALELRDHYEEIEPAWHWNKKYWNQLNLRGTLQDEFIKNLIRHSYAEVAKKLPKRTLREFPEIGSVSNQRPD